MIAPHLLFAFCATNAVVILSLSIRVLHHKPSMPLLVNEKSSSAFAMAFVVVTLLAALTVLPSATLAQVVVGSGTGGEGDRSVDLNELAGKAFLMGNGEAYREDWDCQFYPGPDCGSLECRGRVGSIPGV